ncbi:MAG TPA: DUF4070 domain-containing protein [Chthoniobacterales bacterium]
MNTIVSIQPVGLRAEDLPAYFGSSTVAAEIVKVGILTPVRKVKGLTIYDTGDCARAWIETGSSGNNPKAELNFTPRLGREFLLSGYRQSMQSLHEPRNYYARVRTFLHSYRPCRPFLAFPGVRSSRC